MVLGHDLSKGPRTQDVRISQDVSFDTMLLKSESLRGLHRAGFLKPSPIQLHGIPLGKCGFDLLLEAKSGTGKTAVFTVISLEKLDLKNRVQVIILAPTREIAAQISDVISEIGYYYKGLNVAVVMGGLPIKDDIDKLSEHVHIVVGSPGRLRHLIKEDYIDISGVRLFVLDEADKLMESSFLPDINYIFSLLPKQKQVIMSSATYSDVTKTFLTKYVQKAQHVCPDTNNVLLGIDQKVTHVPYHSNIVKQTQYRYNALKKILTEKQFKQCLIFCNYQARVAELHRMLAQSKWPAEQLYGQQEQTDRLDALKTLQEYKCRILVSTDLAARGIDAANIDLVINFEPPFEWQTYLHRIGRAGRYGSYGTAITILSEKKECKKFKNILRQTNIPFDIRNLWNNESFDLSDLKDSVEEDVESSSTSETSIITDIKNEENFLPVLTLDSSKKEQEIKNETYSLEVLCNSLKASAKPQLNIESFSDLMHSFSVNNMNKASKQITSEYRKVEVCKLNIDNDYLKSLNDNFTIENTHLNKTETTEHKDENENNGYPEDKPNDLENITQMSEIIDDKGIPENGSIQSEIDTKDSYKYVKQHEKFRSHLEEVEFNQALIEASLPTSFGKNKSKSRQRNNKNSYHKLSYDTNNNDNKWNKTKGQHKQKEIENKRNDFKKEIHHKYNTVEENQSDTDEVTDQPQYSAKTNNKKQPLIKSKKDYFKQTSNAQWYKNNLINHSQTQNRSKEFDTWYGQLRRQTQYIQYALYIEEMKKY